MAQILGTNLEIRSGDNTVPLPPPNDIRDRGAYGGMFG